VQIKLRAADSQAAPTGDRIASSIQRIIKSYNMVRQHYVRFSPGVENNVKLQVNGSEHELPLVTGTEGEVGLDISKLRA
jgi:hypothetical protein